jgi:hypothetical protein
MPPILRMRPIRPGRQIRRIRRDRQARVGDVAVDVAADRISP